MIPNLFGELPVHRTLGESQRSELEALRIPLPSARAKLPAGALRDRFERVAAETGLPMDRIRVKHGRDAYFATAARPALSRVTELTNSFESDPLHAGYRALRLSFTLGRGSYATIVIKRITEARSSTGARSSIGVSNADTVR